MEETNGFMLGLGEAGVIGMIAGVSWIFYQVTKEYAKESADQGKHSLWDKIFINGRSVLVSACLFGGIGMNADKPMVIANIWAFFIISSLAALAGGSEGMKDGAERK
jgi:hypothetical protein